MTKEIKAERLHLRITKDLKAKAQAAAEKDNRSLSSYIINLISEDLRRKLLEISSKGEM